MGWFRGLLALIVAVVAAGCLEDGVSDSGGFGCGPGGTCQGASDCYSGCYCETGDSASCEAECGPRGVRVHDLDESAWNADWVAFEDEVLRLTNELRAQGACCGGEGCFAAAPALEPDARLRQAARAHALDMAEREYFAHDAPDGRSPFDRMREAGFRGCAMGENIAAGQPDAQAVIESWRDSPGHCANLLSPNFERIGVGYRPDPGSRTPHVWVQNFGG